MKKFDDLSKSYKISICIALFLGVSLLFFVNKKNTSPNNSSIERMDTISLEQQEEIPLSENPYTHELGPAWNNIQNKTKIGTINISSGAYSRFEYEFNNYLHGRKIYGENFIVSTSFKDSNKATIVLESDNRTIFCYYSISDDKLTFSDN